MSENTSHMDVISSIEMGENNKLLELYLSLIEKMSKSNYRYNYEKNI